MQMEFLKTNFFNTTTMAAVPSNTSTVDNMFDRVRATQFQTSGQNDDTVGVTIGVTFASSKSVNRIVIQNTNLKSFKIYHSSNSANTISLTTTCGTNTSSWTSNSATSLYLIFPTTAMTSVFVVSTSTMAANEEKKIGELWISEVKLQLERNPEADGYKPILDDKEYIHELAGGGWTRYTVSGQDTHFTGSINLKYQSNTQTTALKSLFDERAAMVFVPFPTGTSWNSFNYEHIYEVNWTGDFNFKPAENNFTAVGFDGSVALKESPK